MIVCLVKNVNNPAEIAANKIKNILLSYCISTVCMSYRTQISYSHEIYVHTSYDTQYTYKY